MFEFEPAQLEERKDLQAVGIVVLETVELGIRIERDHEHLRLGWVQSSVARSLTGALENMQRDRKPAAAAWCAPRATRRAIGNRPRAWACVVGRGRGLQVAGRRLWVVAVGCGQWAVGSGQWHHSGRAPRLPHPSSTMSNLIVHGGLALRGEITPSANKNAVLPILCATLLTDQPLRSCRRARHHRRAEDPRYLPHARQRRLDGFSDRGARAASPRDDLRPRRAPGCPRKCVRRSCSCRPCSHVSAWRGSRTTSRAVRWVCARSTRMSKCSSASAHAWSARPIRSSCARTRA